MKLKRTVGETLVAGRFSLVEQGWKKGIMRDKCVFFSTSLSVVVFVLVTRTLGTLVCK